MKSLFLVLATCLLAACASFSPVSKPEVALTGIQLGASNGLQQQLLVGLQLDNPNGFDLKLGRLRYDMQLAGNKLASGRFNDAIVVPANGQITVNVPVGINLLSGLSLLKTLLSNTSDQLDYTLNLSADVANFGLGDVSVVKSGVVGIGLDPAK